MESGFSFFVVFIGMTNDVSRLRPSRVQQVEDKEVDKDGRCLFVLLI